MLMVRFLPLKTEWVHGIIIGIDYTFVDLSIDEATKVGKYINNTQYHPLLKVMDALSSFCTSCHQHLGLRKAHYESKSSCLTVERGYRRFSFIPS